MHAEPDTVAFAVNPAAPTMTDTRISTLCPGCFAAPGRVHPCPHCGYDERAGRAAFLLPQRTLLHDHYLVGRVLGTPGGFGITYLGWDLSLETRVAIKEYLPREWAGRGAGETSVTPHSQEEGALFRYGLERFLAEARTLARIDHPNVVRVRTFFPAHGTAYLVMDYYPGCTLAEYLARRGGRLPEAEAVQLIRPILEGLGAVHAQGFLHRDIKPQNIYLADTGGAPRPLLIDFGAARQGTGERTRTVIYSDGYSPIEQHHEKGRQGPWTDLYATAAVLYRVVTGRDLPDATLRVIGDPLKPAADFGASKALSEALAAALAIRPEDRPQSVAAFAARLGLAAPPVPPGSRPRWYWAAALVPVLALGALGLWRLIESRVHQGMDDRLYAAARAADTADAYSGYLAACAPDGCAHRDEAGQRRDAAGARRVDLDADAAAQSAMAAAAKARAEVEAKAKADADARAKAEAEAKTKAKAEADARARARAEAEAQAGMEAAAKAQERVRTGPRQGPVGTIAQEMVAIPGGSFQMGCSPDDGVCYSGQRPPHQVSVKPFRMGRYEVTQAQWQAVMNANPAHFKGDDRPVEQVSWDDIQTFLGRLNAKGSAKPYRLPTEAEWEYAARAGSKTTYWWGKDLGQGNANCYECGSQWDNKKTAPVGSFKPNAFGLYDTVGNVWEWVQDCWHDSYSGAPVDGSEWHDNCIAGRGLRGGSWSNYAVDARVSDRAGHAPDTRDERLGLRLAQDL